MPQKTEWLIPQRLVITRAWGTISLEDLQSMNAESNGLIQSGIPLVHLVLEFSQVKRFPTGLREIKEVTRNSSPDSIGWTVLVTGNSVVRFIASAIVHAVGARVRMFEDSATALSFIYEQDNTLPQPVPAIQPIDLNAPPTADAKETTVPVEPAAEAQLESTPEKTDS